MSDALKPLTDAELASIRRRTGEGAPDGESINVEAEEVLRLLDEVTRSREMARLREGNPGMVELLKRVLEKQGADCEWRDGRIVLVAPEETRARALLKRIQWTPARSRGDQDYDLPRCIACGSLQSDGLCLSTCELDALIEGK